MRPGWLWPGPESPPSGRSPLPAPSEPYAVRVPCGPDLGVPPEQITTEAILADATGIAETQHVSGAIEVIAGFASRPPAAAFQQSLALQGIEASVEPVVEWGQERAELPDRGITLEVGTTFGHGGHPTTQLALAAIDDLGPGVGRSLLDVGCGTGVLSIAAAKRGFVVSGCDLDPAAVAVATRNAASNGVAEVAGFVAATPTQLADPSSLRGAAGFDVVVVNTLIGVHEAEGSAITALASPEAPLLITGILHGEQLDRAEAAYPGRSVSSTRRDGPWAMALLSHS